MVKFEGKTVYDVLYLIWAGVSSDEFQSAAVPESMEITGPEQATENQNRNQEPGNLHGNLPDWAPRVKTGSGNPKICILTCRTEYLYRVKINTGNPGTSVMITCPTEHQKSNIAQGTDRLAL